MDASIMDDYTAGSESWFTMFGLLEKGGKPGQVYAPIGSGTNRHAQSRTNSGPHKEGELRTIVRDT